MQSQQRAGCGWELSENHRSTLFWANRIDYRAAGLVRQLDIAIMTAQIDRPPSLRDIPFWAPHMNLDGISANPRNLISIPVIFPSFYDSIPIHVYYIEK